MWLDIGHDGFQTPFLYSLVNKVNMVNTVTETNIKQTGEQLSSMFN